MSPLREPYRVVVWGTGRMGRVAISTVAARADFDLVGARVYGADKNGVDAGELAGIPALGVTATSDSEEALRVDAGCILHLARDFGRYDAVEEIVPRLRAGRNVITVHAFQFEHAMAATSCPPDTARRIREACSDGGATFHATGIHPEMIAARMVGTLTGLCTDIVSIKFSENWDVRDRDPRTLSLMGYGRPPQELEANSNAIAQFTDNYGLQSLYGLSRLLGVEPVRIEHEHDFAAAPVDTDPLVLMSFSTTYLDQSAIARRALKAVAGLPVRALLTTGPALDLSSAQIPRNARVVPFAPHAAVLPHAALTVTHAGWATVQASLAAGVPLVCVPDARDQPDNAARVVEAGAGLRVRRSASAAQLRTAITTALRDPSLRAGAQRIGAAFDRTDGAGAVVAGIEQLAPAAAQST